MSAHWHVELEPWVLAHPLLRQDVWDTVAKIPGVRQLNDMEVLSPLTIQEWTLPQEQSMVRAPRPKRTRKKEPCSKHPSEPVTSPLHQPKLM